jgi:hypothetical protein
MQSLRYGGHAEISSGSEHDTAGPTQACISGGCASSMRSCIPLDVMSRLALHIAQFWEPPSPDFTPDTDHDTAILSAASLYFVGYVRPWFFSAVARCSVPRLDTHLGTRSATPSKPTADVDHRCSSASNNCRSQQSRPVLIMAFLEQQSGACATAVSRLTAMLRRPSIRSLCSQAVA